MSQTFPKKLCKYFFLFSLLFITTVSYSQTTKTSYKILGIAVEGNKSADVNTIIANSGLRVGNEIQIPGDQSINAMRQLWALNIFSDVQIFIDKQVAEGVFLLIKVKEYSRFEKAVLAGSDELSDKDIEKKVTFLRGQILKPQDVTRTKDAIQKLYEEDGYLNAIIDPEYFSYSTADTTEDNIIVTWHNDNDLSDEYKLEYSKSDNAYADLIPKIKDRILLKFKIVENDQT